MARSQFAQYGMANLPDDALLNYSKSLLEKEETIQNLYEKATEELVSLIGLGVGLTPSGDDFLCGVLAGLILTGNSDQTFTSILKKRIGMSLKNTNDISRTFLRCALSSHFSKPIKDLVYPASVQDILASFKAVGHSSGFDSLCGIYYVYTLTFN